MYDYRNQQRDRPTVPQATPSRKSAPGETAPAGRGPEPAGVENEGAMLGSGTVQPAAQGRGGSVAGEPGEAGPPERPLQVPPVDILETPDDIRVLVELPGYTEDDIVLEGVNQQVKIFAEREFDESEETKLHLRERMPRAERVVGLPMRVDIEEADATFENGVCQITVPKLEEVRGHRIGFH